MSTEASLAAGSPRWSFWFWWWRRRFPSPPSVRASSPEQTSGCSGQESAREAAGLLPSWVCLDSNLREDKLSLHQTKKKRQSSKQITDIRRIKKSDKQNWEANLLILLGSVQFEAKVWRTEQNRSRFPLQLLCCRASEELTFYLSAAIGLLEALCLGYPNVGARPVPSYSSGGL